MKTINYQTGDRFYVDKFDPQHKCRRKYSKKWEKRNLVEKIEANEYGWIYKVKTTQLGVPEVYERQDDNVDGYSVYPSTMGNDTSYFRVV